MANRGFSDGKYFFYFTGKVPRFRIGQSGEFDGTQDAPLHIIMGHTEQVILTR
jgi:hypothetical protein